MRALQTIRAPLPENEYDLHAIVSSALNKAGFEAHHEVALSPGRRIDFLCENVGVEVKRGKPNRVALIKQLTEYAKSPRVGMLVLIAEHPPRLPDSLCGKKLSVVSLNRLWGIAL